MSAPLAPRDLYFVVVTCECCGRRVRASTMLRAWEKRPRPTLEDAEFMLTRSDGPGRIRNERGPLWTGLSEVPDRDGRYRLGASVASFLDRLDRRMRDAARAVSDGARRARYP
jgi:hypothetical protein